jgi:hypothetical protein
MTTEDLIDALVPPFFRGIRTGKVTVVTRTVAPGAFTDLNGVATFFRIVEANVPFKISLDDDPPIDFSLGMQYRCMPGDWFKALKITNPATNTSALVVTVLMGRGQIDDDRLNVVRERPESIVSSIEPAIEMDPWLGSPIGTYILPAMSTLVLTPDLTVNNRIGMKGFTVANADPNAPLIIRTAAGVPFGRVIDDTSQLFPYSGEYQIRNDNGTGVEVYTAILYWTAQP